MKHLSVCMLALTLLASGLCACGAEDTADTVQTTAIPVSTTTDAAEETTAAPQLELVPQDFGGIDFTFFGVDPNSRQDWTVNTYSETVSEGETGEAISDAIYRRNLELEELYNIHIKEESTTREDVGKTALKVILAGDDAYQVVNLTGISASGLLNNPEALYNLYDISTLDLSHSWWDQNSMDAFTINGKLYNVVGDMNIRSFFSSVVLMMNKQMIETYDLENPFDLVRDGTWTMDKMITLAAAVTSDLDGDGKLGLADTVGFFGETTTGHWGLNSMGVNTVTNIDGTPQITLYSERAVDALTKYVNLLRGGEYAIFANDISSQYAGENIWYSRMMPMLMNNQLLFYNHYLGSSLDLRSMKSDFGIIPMPKYDEAQETYYSATHPCYVSFMTIPATNQNPEQTGTVMEAMNALSSAYVVPAIYETTLVGKVIRDTESEEMLDIIFANRVYDIGYIFDWGGVSNFASSLVNKNSTDFVSAYTKQESKIQKDIDKYLEANT
ncbi:MAG: hypothetical protein IKV66_14065 [Clostridia bacterium]|nr:hypothetical protein [Clostridia bacterium]